MQKRHVFLKSCELIYRPIVADSGVLELSSATVYSYETSSQPARPVTVNSITLLMVGTLRLRILMCASILLKESCLRAVWNF